MAKRVLAIVVLLVVAACAYVGYNSYDAKRSGGTGDIFSNENPAGKSKVDSSGKAPNGRNTSTEEKSPGSDDEPIVYPAAPKQDALVATVAKPATAESRSQVTQTGQVATTPEGDTISPNPPNGMAFSGSGKYQLYRQGNITWRVNTETGQSCIAFATDEEWKKSKVYRAGCGKN